VVGGRDFVPTAQKKWPMMVENRANVFFTQRLMPDLIPVK
jgi:hypothetical protein